MKDVYVEARAIQFEIGVVCELIEYIRNGDVKFFSQAHQLIDCLYNLGCIDCEKHDDLWTALISAHIAGCAKDE